MPHNMPASGAHVRPLFHHKRDATALPHALGVVLGALGRVEGLAAGLGGGSDPAVPGRGPGVGRGPPGPRPRHRGRRRWRHADPPGVARDRRISIEDAQLRHGRKTKSVRIDGSKRHVLTCLDTCLDTCLVAAVGVTAANVAEAEATVAGQITADLDAQKRTLAELDIDRAYLYLSSSLVQDRDPDLQSFCKAFPGSRCATGHG